VGLEARSMYSVAPCAGRPLIDMDKTSQTSQSDEAKDQAGKAPNAALSIAQSVLAAAFGVQSAKNRERDFSERRLRDFIIAGLVFAGLFVASLIVLVQWVITR